MKPTSLIDQVVEQAPDRRGFFQKLSAYSAMFAASAAISTHSADAQTNDITDVDILQFALNLEYLEAEFYTVATTGKTIDAFGIGITGDGMQGTTTGGQSIPFNSNILPIQSIMEELAFDERAHVALLRGALTAAGFDVLPPPTGARFFATDDNALSAVRTPAQVLFLAYGLKSNATGGGFYPAGFNGKLKTSGTTA